MLPAGHGRAASIVTAIESGRMKTVVDKVLPAASIVEAQDYSKSDRAKGKIVLTFQN